MNNSETRNLIAALDVGTSNIVVLIGEIKADGILEIIGVGMHKSNGIKNSMVVNVDAVADAIRYALGDAELMAECKISEVYTGISGSEIRSLNSSGMIKIAGCEISQADIDLVLETAISFRLPPDQYFLHILEQEFCIDGQEAIRKPLGLKGKRLDVEAHIVTGLVAAAQDITECARRSGLQVVEMIFQPLATSKAVLTDDEKDRGVCMLDIGGETSKLAIFFSSVIRRTAVIPLGGDDVTSDIATALNLTFNEAENLKIQYGCAMRRLAADALINVPGTDKCAARMIPCNILAGIIESRIKEIYAVVRKEMRSLDCDEIKKFSVVVTGGVSVMHGMVELGEDVLHMPVRLGITRQVGGLPEVVGNPSFSTVVGLLHYGLEDQG